MSILFRTMQIMCFKQIQLQIQIGDALKACQKGSQGIWFETISVYQDWEPMGCNKMSIEQADIYLVGQR